MHFSQKDGADLSRAGLGGSDMPDVPAEFSDTPFDKGHFLNGQYTVVGRVTGGQDVVDAIKRGTGGNGAIEGTPDVMRKVTVTE